MIPMTIVWLVAAVVFAVAEAATMGLTAIWFSAGALAAMLTAFFSAPLPLQIAVFIVVSGVVLYFTRGLAKKYINNRHERTNADRVVGQHAVVIEEINNDEARGQIRVAGQVWTARGAGQNNIARGTPVIIVGIEGVKAMVAVNREASAARDEE